MKNKEINLKQLKKLNYKSKKIKEELACNLINNLKNGINSFPGIEGYDKTVIPDIERAILSGHDINFLGLRGQAKTKIARILVNLLDEWIPVIKGNELNDDPLNPISVEGKNYIEKFGDDTVVSWLHREDRFFEKLATPDVTVADLIGDLDPIKASNLKLSYADEKVIHFGMIPRAHRCIFVLNELPDLQARIQVSLFSILQEKEIQIRGFKLRLPIDTQMIFTANPEDYTNRGSIVTPLKDRIGSQILTHYPESIEISKKITSQESKIHHNKLSKIYIPEIAKSLIEQISFEARKSEYVDTKSGVSARMSISCYENLLSTAERRMLINQESQTSIRMSDFFGIMPSINGKIELVYEGEQEGARKISFHLINEAVKTLFVNFFPKIEKLQKPDESTPYDNLLAWFFKDNKLFLEDNEKENSYRKKIKSMPEAIELVKKYSKNTKDDDIYFMVEFLLWGLEAHKKLNKYRSIDGFEFKDSLGSYIKNL